MGLTSYYNDLRTGARYAVAKDCQDIAERIQTGDGLVWEGDPRMHVVFNQHEALYEIWRLGEDNVDRLLVSFPPEEWDQRVFMWLVSHDTRKIDILGQVRKINEHAAAKNDELCNEVEAEAMKFLKWCDDRNIWNNTQTPKALKK